MRLCPVPGLLVDDRRHGDGDPLLARLELAARRLAGAGSIRATWLPRRDKAVASGSRAPLPEPSPLRTGHDDCSSSGSSLGRFILAARKIRSWMRPRRPPSQSSPRWTTSSAVARRSVRLSPSNVSDRHWRPGPWLPLRPAGSLRPFGPGLPRSRGPYPPHYRAAFACSGSPLPPPPSPFLAVGLPSCDGTNGAYPVARGGGTTGAAAPFRPAGVGVTVAGGAIRRSDQLTFWSRPPASWACSTVTDFRRAFACAQPFGLR